MFSLAYLFTITTRDASSPPQFSLGKLGTAAVRIFTGQTSFLMPDAQQYKKDFSLLTLLDERVNVFPMAL